MESAAFTNRTKKQLKIRSLVIVSAGASVFFSLYNIYKGNEKFYRDYVMPAVRLIPPETSHNLAVWACKYKLFGGIQHEDKENLKTKFFDKTLSNPVGIAAGFDKHAEAIEGLKQIGFGFVEIGSVTPEPQPGNPQPRVFRLTADNAMINRYGFNSDGHDAVYQRLVELRNQSNFQGVLGVNLGKNKTSPSAVEDYVKGVQVFGPIADYLVINISSPNTPGLRDLQGKKDLENLLKNVIDARNKLPEANKVPVLLKIAPDLTSQDVNDICSVIDKKECRVDGLIVSNTTVGRENLTESGELAKEAGGLSGRPVKEKSTQLIATLYEKTKGKLPIVGVGGVSSGKDAFEKIEAGASYVQLYTAFAFHGPPLVKRIKEDLSDILTTKGYSSVEEAVGKNYKKYLANK